MSPTDTEVTRTPPPVPDADGLVARSTIAPARTAALDVARAFAGSIIYATPEQLDALTLVYAVTHVVDAFHTVPRLLATSKFPESGKTTVLDVARMLASNPWGSNPTSFALRAKFTEPDRPTVLEI